MLRPAACDAAGRRSRLSAVLRQIVEAVNDSLGDPRVRRAKDLRAARDADRRIVVQHIFIIVEVLIAWARDHVTPTSSLSAAA